MIFFTSADGFCSLFLVGRSNPAANDEHAAATCPELQGGGAEQAEGTALEQHNKVHDFSCLLLYLV